MPPIIGVLASTALNALWGVAQNAYNSPKGQLRRLRKAGLPLSYMYQGRVNQSAVPQLSIDPDFGSLEQATFKKTGEETTKLKLENEIKDLENQWLTTLKSTPGIDPVTGKDQIKLWDNLEIAQMQKKSDLFISQNEGRIREIFKTIEEDLLDENVQADTKRESLKKIKQQITNLVSQDKVLGQLVDIRSLEALINKQFSRNLETKEDWQIGLYSMLMEVFRGLSKRL